MLNNTRSVLGRRNHPTVIKRYDSWNPSPPAAGGVENPSHSPSIELRRLYFWRIQYRNQLTADRMSTPNLNPGRIPFRIALRIRKHGPNRLGRGGNFNFDVKTFFVTAARISAATTETARASPMTLTTEDLNGVSPHPGWRWSRPINRSGASKRAKARGSAFPL